MKRWFSDTCWSRPRAIGCAPVALLDLGGRPCHDAVAIGQIAERARHIFEESSAAMARQRRGHVENGRQLLIGEGE